MLRKDVLLGEENEVRREAMEEIRKWAAMEKVLWRKKSTDLWPKEIKSLRFCLAMFLKIVFENKYKKKQFSIVFINKILFGNSNVKNSFSAHIKCKSFKTTLFFQLLLGKLYQKKKN